MPNDPVMAFAILIAIVFGLIMIVFLGLCFLALFLPFILVLAGLFVLISRRIPLPMNVRLLMGFGLIIIGIVWLATTW